jgi:putative hemolysin
VVLSITVLSIVLGELTPKQFALSNPERIAAFSVPLLEKLAAVFNPVVAFLSHLTSLILKSLGIAENAEQAITEEEIREPCWKANATEWWRRKRGGCGRGLLPWGRPVENFMIHRSDMLWLEEGPNEETIRKTALAETRQTVIPLIPRRLDDIVGVVDLRAALRGAPRAVRASSPGKKASFVPGSLSSLKAFEAFKREGVDMLMVLDEYGGLAGAISLRDLVEEIVGELSATDGTWRRSSSGKTAVT